MNINKYWLIMKAYWGIIRNFMLLSLVNKKKVSIRV